MKTFKKYIFLLLMGCFISCVSHPGEEATNPGSLRRLAASDAIPARWAANLITLVK